MSGTVRATSLQLKYSNHDVAPGLARMRANAERLDARLAEDGLGAASDLVVVGEFWLSSPQGAGDYDASALAVPGEVAGVVGEIARTHSVMLSVNVVERAADGQLFDTSLVVDADGRLVLHYREIAGGLLPTSAITTPVGGERLGEPWARGIAGWLPIADTGFGRIAALVGSDLAYPEISAALTVADVDVVLHAAKEGPATGGVWQSVKESRAFEGGFAIVSANIADASDLVGEWGRSRGRSRIIDARGVTIAALDHDSEGAVSVDLDVSIAAEVRASARHTRRRSPEWRAEVAETLAGTRA